MNVSTRALVQAATLLALGLGFAQGRSLERFPLKTFERWLSTQSPASPLAGALLFTPSGSPQSLQHRH